MITMLPTPTSPLRPSAVLLRDPRRSPDATPESSEIHPHQRPQQPIGSHQRAIIIPRYPSTYRLPHPPASTATRSGRNLHSPSHYPRRVHSVTRVHSTEPARPYGARKL